jgi:hypothetical protein
MVTGDFLPMERRPDCEAELSPPLFFQRISLSGSLAPNFLYTYGVLTDKFSFISERIVGKEQVDGIHFLRMWERSTRSEKI